MHRSSNQIAGFCWVIVHCDIKNSDSLRYNFNLKRISGINVNLIQRNFKYGNY